MKVQLTRDLALPLAKKGCTFGVELKTTGKDGETIYFVHYYGNTITTSGGCLRGGRVMERLTKHSKQTSHENGICCTHFRGPECLEVGGNCAMNCKWEEAAWSRLAAYEDKELEPEEVLPKDKADEIALKLMCLADLESLCSYTRLRELAEADENGRLVVIPRQKNEEERLERRRLMRIMADGAIHRLMENPLKEKNGPDIAELRVVNTDRLLELAKADEDGRLFLLPMEPGRSMLCQEYFERPWVMKNVTLSVQYQSSAGIIFYMGYDVFRGLVERGRITPLSQEGEETLEGESECLTSTRCRMRNGSKSPCRPSCL